jgi:hypothetical protein
MAFRYDTGTINGVQRMPDGRLIAPVHMTRTGVFTYRNADGSTRKEYRPPDEVFKPESMNTARMMAVADDHPPKRVDSTNAITIMRGTTGNDVHQDGIYLASTIAVHDGALIAKMERGKRQVSCGYDCRIDATPGVSPEGETYDVVQRDIVYNHLAVVDRGRAGSEVRVRMDAATMDDDVTQHEDSHMDKLIEALAAKADAERKLAEMTVDRDAQRKRADTAEATAESLRKDTDAANKARKDAEDTFNARVQARADLLAVAAKYLRTDDKADDVTKLSDKDIKIAIVKRVDGDDLTGKSDDWVSAACEGAIKRAERGAGALADVAQVANSGRNDATTNEDAEIKAKREMDSRRVDAHKNVKGE